jgi:hypothetical protein
VTATTESIFLTEASIARKLERARDELLDLSARNRLLNMPRHSRTSRMIDAVDEKSAEIYRLLVQEGKAFTFLPGRAQKGAAQEEDGEEIEELAQPEDDSYDDRGVLNRHADTKLQTRLTPSGLQKRLLELYMDARTLEDEQGVNILYLALGTLQWIDPHSKDQVRNAPLVLVPVSLERASAKERFRLRWRQEDCSANLSLEAFLDRAHMLKMPVFSAGDDFDYPAYVDGVADVVATKEGWSVRPDAIALGFFSYAKFLMYRDLDPANWPGGEKLTNAGLIRALLEDGFPEQGERIGEEAHLDDAIRPAEMRHVHDSDSSQVLAAHAARMGENLVIQGPPGTGKSQTIANIIGEAVADGKTVLFVSEKMAALDVVKRRLDQAGVGDACLELHSNKANKRMLLDELRRTWDLGAPKGASVDASDGALVSSRNVLNQHAFRMNRPLATSGLTPYEVVGQLARIQRVNGAGNGLVLEQADRWSAEDRDQRFRLAREITSWIQDQGPPSDHAWWCVEVESILPMEADRTTRTAAELSSKLKASIAEQTELARDLGVDPPERLADFAGIASRARRVSTAPALVAENLAAAEWELREDVNRLVETGVRFTELNSVLRTQVSMTGWAMDTKAAHTALVSLPGHLTGDWLARVERLDQLIPQLIAAADAVRNAIGLAGENAEPSSIQRMIETARHVAAAPPATPESFTAAVWEHGIEQASDLVDAVESLETARQQIGDRVVDAAWVTECGALRQTLAAHGTGLLRRLNGEWRRADRTVKSLLRDPATPLPDVLKLLDQLLKGQKAQLTIQQGDAFGSAAFGPQWRGDRSNSAPLRALSEWSRALGPGSREIRALAARISDPGRVRVDLSCLEAIWTEFTPLLDGLAEGLGCESPQQISLESLKQRTAALVAAQKMCRSLFVQEPESISDWVRLLESLSAWRATEKAITEADELGGHCFGTLWKGPNSDWNALVTATQWTSANPDIRHIAARFGNPGEALERSEQAGARVEQWVSAIEQLFRDVQLDADRLFGSGGVRNIPAAYLNSRLDRWAVSREDLSTWLTYSSRAKRARNIGLRDVIDRLEAGRLDPTKAAIELEQAYYTAVLLSIAGDDPELARFDGSAQQAHVDEFVRLEREHQQGAWVGAMRAHHQRIPRGGVGPVGVLKSEIARRRGHMPVRLLMSHAGTAIQALKPVMMMSPLSVAQFLPPGELKFDLLVMDEASQIQPVDALGAIARCRQAVVVGDERQLPPTRFFARMTGGQADEDDTEMAQVADVESILGLFLARGVPQRTLRWHYRSEHHSLIAVSNSEFYDSKLCILPSPYTQEAGRGVRFHHVAEGVYDSGNTRTNAVEARHVADAVMEHARRHPRQSLGVATFSVAQRRAILDQLEVLRRSNPQTESFFSAHPNEPFFVKNLENIQGDERDVIFISVGYGKNADGQMAMRFGPLSSQGGERRLNVLITRARRRCEVFASITDRDIELERAPGRGVAAFQLFLRFARTGRMDVASGTHGEAAPCVIEEDIATALRGRGYEVDTRVGVSGAFVDVAVLDTEHRGHYVLGIECDGLSYSSARSARDRDRLRREALARQDWRLYRVWSMDWYQRPVEQLERIISAIEVEKQRLKMEAEEQEAAASELAVANSIEREETSNITNAQGATNMYVEASPGRPAGALDLLSTPVQTIASMVAEIVEVEGPIHQDEVVVRIRSVWGLQRTGPRIQDHVTKAIRAARLLRGIEREGKFLNITGRSARLRNRSGVSSKSLRLPEMLAPAEIRAGVADVVRENFGAREEEIISTVVRRLGYAASSANLRHIVEVAIQKMRASGVLAEHGGLLLLAEATAT